MTKRRDEVRIAGWLEAIAGAGEAERQRAAADLCQRVKAHDNGDHRLNVRAQAMIRAALPSFVPHLLIEGKIEGEVISMLRRLRPDAPTVARLLELAEEASGWGLALVVQAIGLCEPGAWSVEAERALVRALDDRQAAYHAAYALRSPLRQPLRPETELALARYDEASRG